MSPMLAAKICGVTSEIALEAAFAGAARFIGLVFFPNSPRYLSLARGAVLAARARDRAEVVAVTVDASDADLTAIAQAVQPHWIQLHGGEDPSRVQQVARFASRGTIKALSIASTSDLDKSAAYEQVADMLLFDAKAPAGAARPGGLGSAFDWRILSGRR